MEFVRQDGLGFFIVSLRKPDLDTILTNERYPFWVKDELRRLIDLYDGVDDNILEFSLMLECDDWNLNWRPAWRTHSEDAWKPITSACFHPLSYKDYYREE